MKLLYLFLMIIVCSSVNATDYYVSASGNDLNNGVSPATPWKTLNKLNSVFFTLKPGDNVLFKRGDTFFGTLNINQSGSLTNPITIGAYSSGDNPIISGFTDITSWTNLGNNIWESTFQVSGLPDCNMVRINGINTPMGRTPNEDIYYNIDNYNGSVSIQSSSLNSSAINWTGANVIIRKGYPGENKCLITACSGNTLNYNDIFSPSPPDKNFGFFINNDARTLDMQNEWYYNPVTKKLRIYSIAKPVNVQAATVNNIINNNGGFDYLIFDNLSITGANNDGIFNNGTTHKITLKNSAISFCGNIGFETTGGDYDSVYNSSTLNCGKAGLFLLGNYAYIGYNTIYNSGVLHGQSNWSIRNCGIFAGAVNIIVEYNTIKNSGCNGISLASNIRGNGICRYNIVDSSCLGNTDNGGIYKGSWSNYILIDHNIVSNTIGYNIGTPNLYNKQAEGIYLDEGAIHCVVTNNTTFNNNGNGIKVHAYTGNTPGVSNTNYNRIEGNTSYNNFLSQLLIQNTNAGLPMFADTIKSNIFFSRLATQLTLNVGDQHNNIPGLGVIDYNYHVRPLSSENIIKTQTSLSYASRNLLSWQLYSGFCKHSAISPLSITDVNDIRFEYNPTPNSKSISLGATYVDARDSIYNGMLTLAPFTSVVLIKTAAIINQPPVANANQDQTTLLPVDYVTLSGSGYDPDGTITSYNWIKIAGPAGYTILNPALPVTDVTRLSLGIYQFELTVTDNRGATGKDTVQVIVKPANLLPGANAGQDQVITLPANSVTLSGSGTDPDGTIVSYNWTKISGPAPYNIFNSTSSATAVTGLVEGVYQFEIQVTDNNGGIAADTIMVTVNPAPNQNPVANAGADQQITLPVNATILSGSGNDPDGTIASFLWTQLSGPTNNNILNGTSAIANITNLIEGLYKFQLEVTDNNGAKGTDVIIIKVNAAANISPTAYAGEDQLITLPIDTALLSGTGSDIDGSVVSYSWSKISGPASFSISNSNTANAHVDGLVAGSYQFQLNVTDNNGAVGTDIVEITVNNATNIPPVAVAGSDQFLLLPQNTVSLTGSGSDSDGTVTNYLWTKISGPASYTIVSPNSANTSVNNLIEGVYQFQLQVIDNNGAVGFSTLQVTISNGGNVPPVANAGQDQEITLPANTVTLSGIASDANGTIASHQWTQISGPVQYNITNASSLFTNVTNLSAGVYQFQLTVVDNDGASAIDIVQIVVNAIPNMPPVANAGPDQTIILPTDSVILSGNGNDPDGIIATYQWTKISGPSMYTIVNAASPATQVLNLIKGIYQFELKVTDNNGATATDIVQITVNFDTATANIPPVANAGINQTITLPVNSISLAGSGGDADGSIASYAWTKISGPPMYNIVNSGSPVTDVSGLTQGVYQFELKVTDNNGAVGTDIMQVTVNAAINIPPVANAGANKIITLPVNSATLSGSGSDPDGTIASYLWTKLSGPSNYTITNATSAVTNITNLVAGTYQFQLKVTDNKGATGTGIVQVVVNPVLNQPPVANAGIDITITLPVNSVSLSGSATDADGTIASYQWTKVSGPSIYTISNATAAITTITHLVAGSYQFELKVTDNKGATGTDIIQVTVNIAANQPPVANAGSDKIITLPVNSIILSGSATDADGTIAGYQWTKLSGPSAYNIISATSAVTNITGLTPGVYQFQLQATDNDGATSADIVRVTVNQAPNRLPVANAGADKTLILPANFTTLTGNGSDADGTINAYQWKKLSGPSTYNIVSPNAAVTDLNGLVQGTYKFELKVTDNDGGEGKDTIQITVNNAVNAVPYAYAGPDKKLTLPVNTVSLSGSGIDVDGVIVAYQWTKLSGPANYNITNSASPVTDVWGLTQGVYKFELKVMDNAGAAGRDTMQIIVLAGNILPVANAGADKTITLPTSNVTLTGSGSDADGTIISYSWKQVAGPASGIIENVNKEVTNVKDLIAGTYEFEFSVIDNAGGIGRDTVVIVVTEPRLNLSGEGNKIKLYPNPVANVTTLEITTVEAYSKLSYTISNTSGKCIYKNDIIPVSNFTKQNIDLTNLSKGLYLLTVQYSDTKRQTLKVIKL